MIITYNKAEVIKDDNGKTFLHLELQVFIAGTRYIIQNVFPATTNYANNELPQLPTGKEIMLKNPRDA